MKRIIKVTATYDLDDPELKGCKITPRDYVEKKVLKEMIDAFGWDEGYEGVEVEVIDTSMITSDKEEQQIIRDLKDKVKRLEKSNRNWRRKCQRLRNESKWFSEMIKPEEHKRVIVRDENGKEYRNHEWVGHAWYSFSGCDGWRTDVDVVSWRYQ
jgi:hypothetical protein